MNKGDLPFVVVVLAGAALLTVVAFFVARMLTRNTCILKAVAGLAAPVLLAGLAVGIETWNPDPHGWVLAALLLLVAICLPVTLLTSDFLARQFAKRDALEGRPMPASRPGKGVPQPVWWTLGSLGAVVVLFFGMVLLGQFLFAFNPNH